MRNLFYSMIRTLPTKCFRPFPLAFPNITVPQYRQSLVRVGVQHAGPHLGKVYLPLSSSANSVSLRYAFFVFLRVSSALATPKSPRVKLSQDTPS